MQACPHGLSQHAGGGGGAGGKGGTHHVLAVDGGSDGECLVQGHSASLSSGQFHARKVPVIGEIMSPPKFMC